jgi:phosphoribosylanthranilate isomerase
VRTRIKICGITSVEDALGAAAAGADAIGLICYPPSPRFVPPEHASEIVRALPAFVAKVAVFVDPTRDEVARLLDAAPIDYLQFHGDEPGAFCASFGRAYLKAARVRPDLDLIEYLEPYAAAAAWLLDTYRADQHGGIGASFDWDLIPARLARPVVLSGGLDATNVGAAIRRIRPWAVDVSSGVEAEERGRARKGVKDMAKIERFVAEVRNADV